MNEEDQIAVIASGSAWHAHAALAAGFADKILTLPAWLVLALVFLLPALEASAFAGFVVPGEVAVILGGAAAWRGTVPLWAVIAAAVAGAVIGDSVGYLIGRRWGDQLLHGTIGRLPVIRRHLDKHLESARAYVRRRRGAAVFFGRFTAALRVLVPGLAGMSQVEYPVFLAYNVAGGALWGTGMAALGYLAGASYQHVEKIAGRAGLGLLALIVAGLVASRLLRRYADRPRLRAAGDRLAAAPPLAWIRRRYPRHMWVAEHRTGWLTAAAKAAAWLGSDAVIAALVISAAAVLAARRHWRPVIMLVLALAGSVTLYVIVQQLAGRSRPPAALSIGHYAGPAFPSGPAATAIACYVMLAITRTAGRPASARALVWAGAAMATVLAGASPVYLGANWLTDVLGGLALGATWVAIILTAELLITRPGGRIATARRPNPSPGSPGHRTPGPAPPQRDLKPAPSRSSRSAGNTSPEVPQPAAPASGNASSGRPNRCAVRMPIHQRLYTCRS